MLPRKQKVLIPNFFQAEALKRLENTKQNKGVVVLPTGTGKTFLSVLWFKKQLETNPKAKLLFICHNKDILSQANEKEFQKHLKCLKLSYSYYHAQEKKLRQATFATTQTLVRSLDKFKKDYFDYIIIDEAHHYQADSFKKIVKHFEPKFMLGLTATPYRMDKKNIFNILGKEIYKTTIANAISKKILTRINYSSVDNDIDWSKWNGKFGEKDLNRIVCVKEYDDSILKEYNETIKKKFDRKKTICFCASVEHTHRMAKLFNDNGIRAVGLTGRHRLKEDLAPRRDREKIIKDFKEGKYDIIFVRDLFNEGVDIPDCDSIMMLRPTQSHTIFTQQIGRGLRKSEGKEDVLILDFPNNEKNCSINYEVLSDIIGKDIIEEIKSKCPPNESIKRSIKIVSNGCKVTLNKQRIYTIVNSGVRTLKDAIREYKRIYWDEKPFRKELYNGHGWIYCHFKEHSLLDKYCKPSKTGRKGKGIILLEIIKEFKKIYGNKKPCRSELDKNYPKIYYQFRINKLLNKYCEPSRQGDTIRRGLPEHIIGYKKIYGNKKPYRKVLSKENQNMYNCFLKHKLLDKYCKDSRNKNRTLQDAIKEFKRIYGDEKPYRREVQKNHRWIYSHLHKNKLLNKHCQPSKKGIRTLQDAIKEAKKIYGDSKPTRKELRINHNWILLHLRRNTLLDKYCIRVRKKPQSLNETIKEYKRIYGDKKTYRGELHKNHNWIYKQFQVNKLLDKYCLPQHSKKESNNNIKITSTYTPKIKLTQNKIKKKKGKGMSVGKGWKGYKSKDDKIDIRKKIIDKIQDGDNVLVLESPELSTIKEIEKQNKKPNKIIIPNHLEFKKLAEAIQNYDTKLNIEIINTSVLQYLVDSEEQFDFIWLDYCGAFSYYIKDLDILFKKHFKDMKLILTYNVFDPIKEDNSYYFTRVIGYVLNKMSGKGQVRLINDVTYRYKKSMYNLGFEIKQK